MDARQRYDDPTETIDTAMRAAQAKIWTTVPCTIVSVDFAKQTCTVQPTVKTQVRKADGSQEWQALPVIPDAPLHFPGGGGVAMTFPVKAGDEALAMISARSIDAWHQSGGEQQQTTMRMHDLSDAMVMVGFRSQPNALPNVSPDAVHIRSTDGTSTISLHPTDGVAISTPNALSISAAGSINFTGTFNVTGDVVLNGIPLSTHKHTDVTPGGGTTGGPTA
ncbi:hypothetical protein LB518_22715 [Mesorhizobium sp. BR1-1-16]|uniref:Gp138 family membrane-puncturing spike protein n=1 Tax=Mesorhizobium sp. BR1-1-16 TaxID=2876653 RepID=UPI001CCB2857|nr:Gp138 family membrane-puncturing spike protein [Mesorhizobium sp. BR1-1-16]MBZ9939127.1 hypothetical protein [Mesorhizobium sp. BR1-1-16]